MASNPKEAFLSYAPEREARYQSRPLGLLSDLAAVNLGGYINAIAQGMDPGELAREAEYRVLKAPPFLELPTHDLPVARLDAQLIANVVCHTGGVLEPGMEEAVVYMAHATSQVSTLTYPDIVRNNPRTDLRTATGTVEEAAFIGAHQRAEDYFHFTIRAMRVAITELQGNRSGQVTATIGFADNDLREVAEILRNLTGGMPTPDFLKFRDFYSPIRPDLKGASAQFSISLPIIDELLAGEKLPDAYRAYIDRNMPFYSESGRQAIRKARAMAMNGNSLRNLTRQSASGLVAAIDELSATKDLVRRTHIGTTIKHLTGIPAGTSGDQDPRAFLEMVYDWTKGM